MSPTASIQSLLIKTEAAAIDAALDDGLPEDVLDTPRALLVRTIKAVDNFRLGPYPSGIALIGDLQMRLAALLARVDKCLPKMSVETSMTQARPVLAEIVGAVPQLLEDVKRLERFVSPLAMWD
ncbi:hypothetical protein PQQ86_11855 [Paraburkholderia sediminicola]|uniref:hypothetical protein n=1 Tax=Paraburkholderia TaxID=1822464 RepID=UPI0038B99959